MTNKIILRFVESDVMSKGLHWYQPDIAIRIIERAKETRTPVLGFLDAVLRPDGIRESLEHGWNYIRAKPPIQNAREHAVQFMSRHGDLGPLFEIILPNI
jgi:hypothetical protein